MSGNNTKTTVLVTGFGPFGDHQVNASWETVKLLAKKGLGDGIDLIIYEIPVEYDTVKKVVPTFWDKHKPDLVVHTGVSDYVSKFTLEQHAHNNGYTTLDVKGCPAVGSCCIVGEADILVSGINMSVVCEQMSKANIEVKTDVSYLDCGRVCPLEEGGRLENGRVTALECSSENNYSTTLDSLQLVVHVGVSSFATELTIEQQAHNDGYSRLDVKGCVADGGCCVDGEDEVLVAGLDMKTVCEDVNCSETKANAEISHDPGRYLCDFSYFTSLHINRNRCAFIHVPPLDNPYSVEELADGLKAAILAMLKQLGL